MKRLLIPALLFILLSFSLPAVAGNDKRLIEMMPVSQPIKLKVTPWENGIPLPGVSIRLSKDSTVIRDFKTFRPDGWTEEMAYVTFTLDENTKYTITLEKKGYVKLVVMVDTHLPAGTVLDPQKPALADVMMVKEAEHPNLKDADFPLVLLKWDAEKHQFLPSKEYANSIRMMMQMK